MKLEQFTHLLDVYGGDSSAWPAQDSERVQALLRENAQARELLQQQRRMESLLDEIEAPRVSRPRGEGAAPAAAGQDPRTG